LLRAAVLVTFALAALPASASYAVRVEEGQRVTSSGDTVRYELYIPSGPSGPSGPEAMEEPRPAVLLNHGFARSLRFHRDNARYLAERGVIVLVPNLVSLLGGAPAQRRNIENTADHLRWLLERSATPGDSIEGRVDPARLGLAGHSAGAAVSFEAALALVGSGTPVEALALLDGVPWPRTTRVASALPPLDFVSLTSDPSSCNAFGNVRRLEEKLRFPSEEVHLLGATHCDPESPTDVLCRIVCGGGSPDAQSRYRSLLQLFFAKAFGEDAANAYEAELEALELAGTAERRALGPDVAVSLRVDGGRGAEESRRRPGRAIRVSVDVLARPTGEVAAWYLGLRAGGNVFWVTPGGLRTRPAPLARFEPIPLDDVPLYEGPRPAEGEIRVFLLVIEGGRLLASDRVVVSGS
jgi:hypothetical protein